MCTCLMLIDVDPMDMHNLRTAASPICSYLSSENEGGY